MKKSLTHIKVDNIKRKKRKIEQAKQRLGLSCNLKACKGLVSLISLQARQSTVVSTTLLVLIVKCWWWYGMGMVILKGNDLFTVSVQEKSKVREREWVRERKRERERTLGAREQVERQTCSPPETQPAERVVLSLSLSLSRNLTEKSKYWAVKV